MGLLYKRLLEEFHRSLALILRRGNQQPEVDEEVLPRPGSREKPQVSTDYVRRGSRFDVPGDRALLYGELGGPCLQPEKGIKILV